MIECQFQHRASRTHSDDRVTVYHGQARSLVLCGYHASPEWLPSVYQWLAVTGRD